MDMFQPIPEMPHLRDIMALYATTKLSSDDEKRIRLSCNYGGWIDVPQDKLEKYLNEKCTIYANAHFIGQSMIPVKSRQREIPEIMLKQLSQQGVIRCVRDIKCEPVNNGQHRIVSLHCVVTKLSIKKCLYVTIRMCQLADDIELARPEYIRAEEEQKEKRRLAKKALLDQQDPSTAATKRRTNHDMHEYSDSEDEEEEKKSTSKGNKKVDVEDDDEDDGFKLEIDVNDPHRVTKTPSTFIGYQFTTGKLTVIELNNCINFHV